MKTIVCYPLKSMVGAFMPQACEVLFADQPEECFELAALHRPQAVILFSEMFSAPPWEWLPPLQAKLPAEVRKIVVPLHKDEQIIKQIAADEQLSHTYVLPASLSYEEIGRQLAAILGLAEEAPVQPQLPRRENKGTVYTLCSHGGAGVTTFAINFPLVLARRNPLATIAVVDMSAAKPDLTHFFELDQHQLSLFRPDLLSLQAAERRAWHTAFKVSEYRPNLYYTSAISHWRSHEISVLLAVLRSRFDFVLIDYGCCFPESEALHRLVQEADYNLFFARSDPFSLQGAANWARQWQPLLRNLLLLVTNHDREMISASRIKLAARLPLFWSIPCLPAGRLLQSLMSRSVLVEEWFPPRAYLNSLHGLAQQLANREEVSVSG